MSFDIFVTRFHRGNALTFPRSVVEDIFKPYITGREGNESLLTSFSDGGEAEIFFGDEPEISGFAINRPPISPEFWQGLIAVLKAIDGVLYWAGDGCVITNPAVRDELPRRMLEGVGEPTVTEDVETVLDCIRRG